MEYANLFDFTIFYPGGKTAHLLKMPIILLKLFLKKNAALNKGDESCFFKVAGKYPF